MSKAERVVLVDGSWLVFRAFFAIPPHLVTKKGLHTNAVYGFATMFRKLFSGKKPDRGAIVFDAPGKRVREEKFAGYKAHRPRAPIELLEQLEWIDRIVAANNFPVLRREGYEADDVIGTLARQAVEQSMEVVIVAGDKDFAQVVSDRVRMLDTLRDVTYDPELVYKKWSVRPSQIVDLLALMGDTSDNIPGVPGVGLKGAAQLLEKYGSLDGIYGHLDELKGRQRASLEAHREEALLWRDLATIDQHVPLDAGIEALAIVPPEPAKLNELYKELEFFSLLTDEDVATVGDSEAGVEYRTVDTLDAARDAVDSLPPRACVAIVPIFDLPSPIDGTLVGLAFASEPARAFYLPLAGDGSCLDAAAALELVRRIFEDPERPKLAHNVKELWIILRRHGIELRGPIEDAMLASFLIEPTKIVPHRLDQVAKEYLQRTIRPLKGIVGSGQKTRRLSEIAVADASAHACRLVDVLVRAWPVIEQRLAGEGQTAQYRDNELPLAFVLARMEMAGVLVDKPDLARMGEEFAARKAELEEKIYALAGRTFNIGSTKQLAQVLFEELRLPVVKRTKTGYSTDSDVLERLAPKNEIVRHVLAQRTLAKLINTYTDVLQNAVRPSTGRIHAVFQQTVAASGRLISTDPDLQRTPIRTPEGRRIRQAFVAPPGHKLISADWSQIELRVLAHFSRDEALLEAFRDDLDLHRRTAGLLFSCAPEEVTSEQRAVGKTVNFATIYGQGATALGQILGIPRKEALGHIERYFQHYAGVRSWLDRTIAEALERGYVTTLLGRRRTIPELSSRNEQDRQAGERIAANTPIQGSAADICKLAMVQIGERIERLGLTTRMLIQVHDELVFEAPEDEVKVTCDLVRDVMERPCPLDVPLVVDVGVGNTWAEAH